MHYLAKNFIDQKIVHGTEHQVKDQKIHQYLWEELNSYLALRVDTEMNEKTWVNIAFYPTWPSTWFCKMQNQ